MGDSIILEFSAFVRSFKQNKDSACAFLLGAGASITSDIQSANDCIWEWKKDIYCSSNPNAARLFQNYRSDIVRKRIQEWLDIQGIYPELNSKEEYSFYVEKAYPIEGDRVKYFSDLVNNKAPYIGYKLLGLLNKYGVVKSVWTTNFDGLIERTAHQLNITPIAINLDNPERIYRNDRVSELLCVALHGDYKYSRLKNTTKELDAQEQTFKEALKRYFVDKNLVVCGYSGRDISLMNALKEAFAEKGSGRIYWCGYGTEIPKEVESLINSARRSGRYACYIPTDGFDSTIISLALACTEDNIDRRNEIELEMSNMTPEDSITSFVIQNDNCDKYLKSNMYPVVLPKEVFQFEIQYKDKESAWSTLRKLTAETSTIAVPFKGKVYAFSTISEINKIFGSRICSDIVREAVSIKDIQNVSAFRDLFLSAILKGISMQKGLNTDGRYKLWKPQYHSTFCQAYVYDAVECSLIFPENKDYIFLSLKPTVYLQSNTSISQETKLLVGKKFLDKLWNKQYDEKLCDWEHSIFNGGNISFDLPFNSKSDFVFKIGHNRAFASLSVLNSSQKHYQPNSINAKSIIFRGAQFKEPLLEFTNANNGNIYTDYHPMRGLNQHKPYDYEYNGLVFSEDIKLGVICPQANSATLHSFLQGFNTQIPAKNNSDYMVDYIGFQKIYNIPLDIPNIGSEKWIDILKTYNSPQELAKSICRKIDSLSDSYSGLVVIIFIPKEWESLKRISENGEMFDLHDYVKAYAAQHKITTQFIEESTLLDTMKLEIYWWLSLAFYIKSLRTPWVLSNINNETAYAGIGYSVKLDKQGKANVVLGCSHIYNAKGQGLKYKLSKINNPILDKKKNPFLTYDEAFKFGVSIRELFMESMDMLPKRVVIHKRTPFRKEEIDGIKDSLGKAGITNIDLIEINFERDIRYMSQKVNYGTLETDNFPLSRGVCLITSKYEALLWTHGIVPSVRNVNYKYYMGGNSIPEALRIRKHYGKGDLNTIATEILGFTKMNWNSFNLYTKLPATIDSSNALAKIGNLLSKYEGRTYDYRYFI